MIPLVPTLALAFLSFIASVFVILRIVLPILPPHPLSRRVPPSEFGLPNFRTLSAADKSHLWLASLDLIALVVFVWQAVAEDLGGPTGFADSHDPLAAARVWFALTLRQVCLLVVASMTLLHVRMGRSVSFGKTQWMLWAPTALVVGTATALASVFAASGVASFFPGLVAFSSTIALASSVVFACLIGTLVIIRRNLAALNDPAEAWPPARAVEEKPRPSFNTEDIDAIREGSSWITSNASSQSHHESVSAWSFSTRRGSVRAPVAPKSSYWFNPASQEAIPPVPPLPSAYRPTSPADSLSDDPDPFRRDAPGEAQRVRNGSQTSWLTSAAESQATLSAWSFPTTHHEGTTAYNASSPDVRTHMLPPRPLTPAMADAQVLGGYGYAPQSLTDAEKGLASLAVSGSEIDISVYRAVGWLITIWVPLALSLPYLFMATPGSNPSPIFPIMLALSVTLSSPLLAMNILFRSPIPIPSGLFDVHADPPSVCMRAPSPHSTNSLENYAREYKRSGSVTVVEGRRSGDVWVAKGDAIDGKNKVGRAIGLLSPNPRLAVLPTEGGEQQDGELTPPLPMQMERTPTISTVPPTPQSTNSAELGRLRKESQVSSRFSGGSESLGYASRIMVAQKHYSALAQTVVLAGSPEKRASHAVNATGAAVSGTQTTHTLGTHLRSRSTSSMSGPRSVTLDDSLSPSPPPSFPLPPTPPSVKAARRAKLGHRKSFSSGNFSFGAVNNDDMNEIDALTAGVLPLLVPGLKVGHDMRIGGDMRMVENWDMSPPSSHARSTVGKRSRRSKVSSEFGGFSEWESPDMHSTPARTHAAARQRKVSGHKRNHYSLPSLGLGKEGVHSLAAWKAEVQSALEKQLKKSPSTFDIGRRNTVWGGESAAPAQLNAVREEEEPRSKSPVHATATGATLGRSQSIRSLGLRADVPYNVNTARSSVATLMSDIASMLPPNSAASTATLFEFDPPNAHSTPHNSLKATKSRQPEPPLPATAPVMSERPNRRSSIVYIKSDDSENSPTNPAPTPAPTPASSGRTFAQWSSRAVRPLIPKTNKPERQMPSISENSKPDSPSGGLRPLSLLKERDSCTALPASPEGTRPLILGKKQKQKVQDENTEPTPRPSKGRSLKPLRLARSDTSKLRGILRKQETLPDVVVRPPSQTDHTGFAYSFR